MGTYEITIHTAVCDVTGCEKLYGDEEDWSWNESWESDLMTAVGDTDYWHPCYFCGTSVRAGVEAGGERHWLSDCRPDLVEHPPGDLCTWAYRRTEGMSGEDLLRVCYAYNAETFEHGVVHQDGPM